MRRNRFLIYSLLLLAVIGAVMILFTIHADKKLASVQAGALFVLIPLGLLFYEVSQYKFQRRLWIVSVLQFWLLFALPIMGLRLLYWDEEFSTLTILGVSGAMLHSWSSKSYMLMLIVTWIEGVSLWKQRRQRV